MIRTALVPIVVATLMGYAGTASAQTPPAGTQHDAFLAGLGATIAAQMYTSHAYVGVVADAFVKEVYTSRQTRAMMDEVSGMMKNVTGFLVKARDANISPADKAYLNQSIDILGLLQEQAEALKRFAGTAAEADKQRYLASRQQAWTRIKAALNLPDPPQ